MSDELSRRRFVKSIAASSAVILGFDSVSRNWVAGATGSQTRFDSLPTLDGALSYEAATLREFADDYGHIVHRPPHAILNPASVQDVVKMVQYANRHNIKIAMSGNHHATYGQSQVEAGIVINSRGLNKVLSIDSLSANVQAGALWSELLQESLKRGLTPPVLAEYQGITVGGTLSVGGLGVSSPRYGSQGDSVLELDVVTGDGRLVTCSPASNSDLFNAALGGLGQCGIIVQAKVTLVSAPTHAATSILSYGNLDSYLADALLIAAELRFEHQQGGPVIQPDGSWRYLMEVTKFYTPPQQPDFTKLETGLRFTSRLEPGISSYWDYVHRTSERVAAGRQVPHPRIEVFVPSSKTSAYLKRIMSTPIDYAGAAEFPKFRVFALNSAPFKRGSFQVPRGEAQFFIVGLLRSTALGEDELVSMMVDNNRLWFERARDAGGKLYPICAVSLAPADWQTHFGAAWQSLAEAKRRYDPRNLLTPGQGMFRN